MRQLTPTADPKKIVDTLRERLRDTPSNELHQYVRECLRITRKQGRQQRPHPGQKLCYDPAHDSEWEVGGK